MNNPQNNPGMATEETLIDDLNPSADPIVQTVNQSQQTAQQQVQTPQAPHTQQAPDIIGIMKNMLVATPLHHKGSKYITTLKSYLTEKVPSKPSFYSLSYPAEALGIVSGHNAMLLVFSETSAMNDRYPLVSVFKDAIENFQNIVGNGVAIFNTIIVTPQDYDKVDVMGAHIANIFTTHSDSTILNLNVNNINKHQIETVTSEKAYMEYFRKNNPHGIPARASLTLTFYINVPKKNATGANDFFNQRNMDRYELAAVGAYVDFVQSSQTVNGVPKFIPLVHISEVTTNMPCDGVLALVLALTKEYLLDNQYWKVQFSDLSGPNKTNIGNLLIDGNTGQSYRVDNLQGRDQVIANYCENPILILDVVEGRARIPGIEFYANPTAYNDKILEGYNVFLQDPKNPGAQVFAPGETISSPFYATYDGYVSVTGGQPVDTRWIDFLSVMIHHSTDRPRCQLLLQRYKDPAQWLEVIKQFHNDIQLLYYTCYSLILPAPICKLQSAIRNTVRVVNGNIATGATDVSALLTAGLGYQNAMVNGGAGIFMTPFASQIYNPTGGLVNLLYR